MSEFVEVSCVVYLNAVLAGYYPLYSLSDENNPCKLRLVEGVSLMPTKSKYRGECWC